MFSLLERGRVVEDTAVSCVRNSEDQARCFADARRQERQVAGSSDWRRRAWCVVVYVLVLYLCK